MKLSIVIATFNRADVLKMNLDKFREQSDMDFEIVVSMDGSVDHTESMLKSYQKSSPFDLKWVNTFETDKYCIGKARNIGILETTGNAVVILDDDSFPEKDLVKEHKRTVRKKTFTGGARLSENPNDELHKKMSYFKKKLYYISNLPKSRVVENNCCMYRDDWINCGMFSERLEGYGGVGQEFSRRLHNQGFVYQFNPEAVIYHHREFEGDNSLTCEVKEQQSIEMYKTLQKFGYKCKPKGFLKNVLLNLFK